MIEVLRCTVNNKPVEVGIDPRESLADVLRERLGLTSVKKGCEVGECGACTVLVDGTAIDSCIYLGVWAQGKSILTVEGLQEPDGGLSPIQRAFVEEAAVQCGFCTPGIIMSAVEIVGSGKQYTREELRKLISGHLCRCTGYQNILNAVERAVDEAHRFEKGNKDKRETPVGRLPFCGPMRASAPTGRAELAPNTCIPGPGFGSCAVDNDSARTKGGNSCHPGKYSAAGSGRKSRIPVRLQFHIYTSLSPKTILCKKCIKCNMQFLHDIC